MTNVEHLIENALTTLENTGSLKSFCENELNQHLAEESGVSLETIETIALYIRHTYIPETLDYLAHIYINSDKWRQRP